MRNRKHSEMIPEKACHQQAHLGIIKKKKWYNSLSCHEKPVSMRTAQVFFAAGRFQCRIVQANISCKFQVVVFFFFAEFFTHALPLPQYIFMEGSVASATCMVSCLISFSLNLRQALGGKKGNQNPDWGTDRQSVQGNSKQNENTLSSSSKFAKFQINCLGLSLVTPFPNASSLLKGIICS